MWYSTYNRHNNSGKTKKKHKRMIRLIITRKMKEYVWANNVTTCYAKPQGVVNIKYVKFFCCWIFHVYLLSNPKLLEVPMVKYLLKSVIYEYYTQHSIHTLGSIIHYNSHALCFLTIVKYWVHPLFSKISNSL